MQAIIWVKILLSKTAFLQDQCHCRHRHTYQQPDDSHVTNVYYYH